MRALIFLSGGALACSNNENMAIDRLINEIKNKDPLNRSEKFDFSLLEAQCKNWPARKGLSIIAKPYSYTTASGATEETYLAAIIATINSSTGEITSRINEKKILEIDSIYPSEIRIDTARYELSEKDVAFEIRLSQTNQSSAAQFK